ncbi:hypothetical protein NDU88_004043 [Pleurodeles waltl]|uniref:Uncharacterized protein n=1 Tax=Pleurodeles waltl TaxID=8319 RepID=A0AAV7WU73_PLEWA|nr:hypothetical protein NDU88_004043 [Pleurodeles waltl]
MEEGKSIDLSLRVLCSYTRGQPSTLATSGISHSAVEKKKQRKNIRNGRVVLRSTQPEPRNPYPRPKRLLPIPPHSTEVGAGCTSDPIHPHRREGTGDILPCASAARHHQPIARQVGREPWAQPQRAASIRAPQASRPQREDAWEAEARYSLPTRPLPVDGDTARQNLPSRGERPRGVSTGVPEKRGTATCLT